MLLPARMRAAVFNAKGRGVIASCLLMAIVGCGPAERPGAQPAGASVNPTVLTAPLPDPNHNLNGQTSFRCRALLESELTPGSTDALRPRGSKASSAQVRTTYPVSVVDPEPCRSCLRRATRRARRVDSSSPSRAIQASSSWRPTSTVSRATVSCSTSQTALRFGQRSGRTSSATGPRPGQAHFSRANENAPANIRLQPTAANGLMSPLRLKRRR